MGRNSNSGPDAGSDANSKSGSQPHHRPGMRVPGVWIFFATCLVVAVLVGPTVVAQARLPDIDVLDISGALSVTDGDGSEIGVLTVSGNLRPALVRDASEAADATPGSTPGLVLPAVDGSAQLELPGATVVYADEHEGGGGGFFDTTEAAPPGMHYAIVQLSVVNRTFAPMAGSRQSSFFGQSDDPWLFGLDSQGGLAAPADGPAGLPCDDINPGATVVCELAFLLPEERTLASLHILWPTGFALALPAAEE